MEDAARKEKLAAAKKKLKKFQKTGKTPNNSPAPAKGENGSVKKNERNNGQTPVPGKKANGKSVLNAPSPPPPAVSPPPSAVQVSAHLSHENLSITSTPPDRPSPNNQALTASTERLQQLSRTVNGLISESSAYVNNESSASNNGDLSDLERRNQELASLLEHQTQANEQLTRQINEMKLQTGKLQAGLESERKSFDEKLKLEIGALKEQLQVHIQTIGILVSEKTELQSNLTQAQKVAEQRIEEIEELSGRLKASRQRVADLERNLTSASSSSHKHEKSSKELSKELDRIKLELYKTNKSNEEYQQQNSELQGKLQKKIGECVKLEDSLIDVKGKLEMTGLQLTQLQNTGGSSQPDADSVQQIESLLKDKSELSSTVDQYKETCKKIADERDQLSQQYQEYIEQIQQQNQHLQAQISNLTEERSGLVSQQQELSARVEEAREAGSSEAREQAALSEQTRRERDELAGRLEEISAHLEHTRKQHEAQVQDNSQLSRLVMEKETRIMEMEMSVQQMSDQQVDKEQLLESMQSDKTALSRAIAQNKELKTQLAELQNGFVKMSNDNMELMSQLSSEQHVAKELASRLSQQEDELKEIREQLVNKEGQLSELQTNLENSSRTERTRTASMMSEAEFTEQVPLIENLQKELASAQDTINALTNQNSLLRSEAVRDTDGNDNLNDNNAKHMENMSAAIKQLEAERNQVIQELQTEQHEREDLRSKLDKLRTELATQAPATLNGDVINKAQFEALQHAMKQLENKYTKAMRDKADLMDKTEQLEHIIMQLQGETDTIGEYVALYQQQRTILKQRTVEKDNYISHLARDREEMSDKLGQLQAAVMQLLQERQMLHPYSPASPGSAVPLQGGGTGDMNHRPPASSPRDKSFGKLDSTQLEDWPDYNSTNSDDSDDSAVEPILAGAGEGAPKQSHSISQAPSPARAQDTAHTPPREDHTAQRIMSLLTEIGTSHIVDRTALSDTHFIHCDRCTGQLLNV